MANPWLRLWVDMPNDPKWRTIAKVSGTSIPLVLSVYLHILVSASNATERGRTQGLQIEDISSALDTDVEKIGDVLKAMQGRVLQGDVVTGWDKRQPIREDSSAERAKQWRERNRTQPNAQFVRRGYWQCNRHRKTSCGGNFRGHARAGFRW